MRIVFVTPYFAPAWGYGGPPRVLYTLAKGLVKIGHQVNVITTDALDKNRIKVHRQTIDGIKIHRFKTISNALAYRGKIFFVPFLLPKTHDLLKQADRILFSDLRSILNWQLYANVYKLNIPYGVFIFGQIPYDSGAKAWVKKLFDFLWVRDFIRKASWRFYQTKHEKKMLNQFFGVKPSDAHFLPLAVDVKNIKIGNKELLEKNNLSLGDKILLFVGRFHHLKGVDLLIKATIPLLRRDRSIKLVLVGRDDGVEKDLRKMVPLDLAGSVIFTGPLYNHDIYNMYSSASCFVTTPRFYEETSLAALEALSFGVPVVVTEQAEIPFLEQYQAGLVVRNTPTCILDGLNKVLSKLKRERKPFQLRARKLVKEKFDSGVVASQLNNYLKDKK